MVSEEANGTKPAAPHGHLDTKISDEVPQKTGKAQRPDGPLARTERAALEKHERPRVPYIGELPGADDA